MQLERLVQQMTAQFEALHKEQEAFKTKYKIRYTTAAEVSSFSVVFICISNARTGTGAAQQSPGLELDCNIVVFRTTNVKKIIETRSDLLRRSLDFLLVHLPRIRNGGLEIKLHLLHDGFARWSMFA